MTIPSVEEKELTQYRVGIGNYNVKFQPETVGETL